MVLSFSHNYDVSGQVLYLIVLIPDLCLLYSGLHGGCDWVILYVYLLSSIEILL